MLTWRALAPAAILAAIGANLWTSVSNGDFRFFDFFGYFTNQTNLLAAAVLLIALRYTGRERPVWVEWARVSVATYLVIVTAVYWTMLTHENVSHPWANLIIHGLSAVVLVVDWLVEGPRRPLPLRGVGIVLAFGLAWIAVVLVRGATDGWVPYPFLDPVNGYAPLAIVIASLIMVGLAITVALTQLSRWRAVVPADAHAEMPQSRRVDAA